MPNRLPALLSLIVNAGCITAAELLLKLGATATTQQSLLGIHALDSWYTLGGILCYLAGFATWLYALKILPLSLAFNFTTIQQALVAIGAWWFLHETMPLMRVIGIGILMTGVFFLVPAIVAAEAKTEPPAKPAPPESSPGGQPQAGAP